MTTTLLSEKRKSYKVPVECPICHKLRFVYKGPAYSQKTRCRECFIKQDRREKVHNWKGGKFKQDGYIHVIIYPDNFFYPMATKRGYILEHRLIIAKHLGRNLQPWELVHHKNGIRDDNRVENLELLTPSEHLGSHTKGYQDGFRQGYLEGKSKIMEELRQEIKLLQWQVKELKEEIKCPQHC